MCTKCGQSRDDVPFVKGRNLCRECFNAYHREKQRGRRRKRRFERTLANVRTVRE